MLSIASINAHSLLLIFPMAYDPLSLLIAFYPRALLLFLTCKWFDEPVDTRENKSGTSFHNYVNTGVNNPSL